MIWSKDANYGQIIGQLPFLGTGKVFIVGDTSTVNIDMIKQLFDVDQDGDVRYHTTLDAALGFATADAGDRIYLLPGHTETIATTGTALLDVTGVTVEGIGQGGLIPLFDVTSTSGKIQITAANTTLKNVRIRPGSGSSGGATAIELLSTSATPNITLDGIVWGPRSSQCANFDNFVSLGTNSSGANYFDGLTVKNNVFQYYTTSVTGAGILFSLVTDGLTNFSFTDNVGSVFSSAGMLQSSGTGYGWNISGNRIHNQSTSVLMIDINGTATYGIMANNFFSGLSTGAKGTMIDPGVLGVVETYVVTQSNANYSGVIPFAPVT